ncbi:biotin transporter BioY [Ruania alba]|uniref:Biotin transporter n=1 Tax=Ruania alba TaxID=648782 RepID=A0A1H5LTF1_9MICO|nr:biotin transporter BioY [Ruania alba]SEE80316.1 biotin transport system substrate-specific component [Ruania alba]
MSIAAAAPRDYLLRPWTGTWARDAALVSGAVVLTALLAQVSLPVPGSPVPVTGQTLAVLLVGTTMGLRRGVVAMGAYLLLGAVGMPVFADGGSGAVALIGPTGGYLAGFLLAAAVMGRLAERGWDRSPLRMLGLGLLGQATVFAVGVPWLALSAGLGPAEAIAAGFTPFIVGGLIKGALAGMLLPSAWRLVRRETHVPNP